MTILPEASATILEMESLAEVATAAAKSAAVPKVLLKRPLPPRLKPAVGTLVTEEDAAVASDAAGKLQPAPLLLLPPLLTGMMAGIDAVEPPGLAVAVLFDDAPLLW